MKKLRQYWDDDLAEFHYELVEIQNVPNHILDGTGITTVDGFHAVESVIATGGKDWAERQAEHYHLAIEERS